MAKKVTKVPAVVGPRTMRKRVKPRNPPPPEKPVPPLRTYQIAIPADLLTGERGSPTSTTVVAVEAHSFDVVDGSLILTVIDRYDAGGWTESHPVWAKAVGNWFSIEEAVMATATDPLAVRQLGEE